MARNGSGTFNLLSTVAIGESPISSTKFNSLMVDVATGLTTSIATDGQTTPSANLPMGGYKHTGVANATARTDYCTAGQSQDNTFDWLTSVSGSDTITANAAIGMAAYAAGQTFRFVAAGANTTAATLNINSIGAKAIKKNGTTALAAGDIPSGAVVEVVYDGTNFQIVGGAITSVGAITGVTAAQFDSSTKLSTTAFIQTALGSFRGSVQYTDTTATLTVADIGKIIIAGGSNDTFILPLASACGAGSAMLFTSQGAQMTFQRQGSDTIANGASTGNTSLTYTYGAHYVLMVCFGTGTWLVVMSGTLI